MKSLQVINQPLTVLMFLPGKPGQPQEQPCPVADLKSDEVISSQDDEVLGILWNAYLAMNVSLLRVPSGQKQQGTFQNLQLRHTACSGVNRS